jgi:hypothetical protein
MVDERGFAPGCNNFLEGKEKQRKQKNEHSASGPLLAVPMPRGSQQLWRSSFDVKG